MAIADRLNKLRTDIEDTYQAINEIGGTIPSDKNTNNISEAIRSVYDNLPKVSDTGTNVSLSPTLKGRLGIVPKGNTYQESYSGTQLFNASAISNTNIIVSDDGKTITMPIISSGNGIVSTSKKLSELCPELSVGDVVYLKATTTSSTNTYIYLNTSDYLWYFGGSRTITQNDLNSIVNLYGNRYSAGETNQVIISDFRIVKNSTDTWEKYVGGTASPSPDYPQEIQSATGTQKVVVSGKNLIPTNEFTLHRTNKRTIQIDFVTPLPAGTYTISWKIVNQSGLTNSTPMGWALYNGSTNLGNLPLLYDGITTTSFTKTTSEQITHLYAYINSSASSDATITIEDLQIEKGNTATSYQPYQEPQEVDIELSSRNLFDKDNTVVGWIRSNNGTINPESGSHTSNFIKIKPNTNYIRTTREGNAFYDENKEFISYTYGNNYETPNNAKYIRITVTDVNINQEQLEEGSTATDYTPYYNYSLNKIGNYEDYIDGTPDNWSVVRQINSHTITNSDISIISPYWLSTHGVYGAGILKSTLGLSNTTTDKNSLCSVSNKINAIANISENTYIFNGNASYVFFFSSEFDTLENARIKLNDATLIYNLDEPTITPITDTNLIEQLNELYYLQSYNDTTNIDVTGNLPMRITASAIKGE